jgi:hypothetical protein
VPDSVHLLEKSNPPDDKRGGAQLFDLVEKIVKLSAVLGVFGYMSLRSHLNYLGIPSTSSLGIERYLMETYNLVVTTFFPLVSVLLRIGLALFFLYLLSPLLVRIFKRFSPFLKKVLRIKGPSAPIAETLRGYSAKPIVPGLLLLFVLVLYIWLQEMLDANWQYDSVVVGPLQSSHLEHTDAVWFYYLICLLCIFGFLAYSLVSRIQKLQPQPKGYKLGRLLLVMFAIGVVGLALHLPILYGRLIHYTNYTLVGFDYKVGDQSVPICGLLVLDSQSSVLIWRAERGAGNILEVPRSQIQTMSSGPTLDLIKSAQDAANKGTKQPDCKILTDRQENLATRYGE